MKISQHRAVTILQRHGFAPYLVPSAGNAFPAIEWDHGANEPLLEILPADEFGMYCLDRLRWALGY